MQAVTFQAVRDVLVEERPEPEPIARDDAVVAVEAAGICGSDLHIYHGRVEVEPGFTIGHEFGGSVRAAGEGVTRAAVGDRVLGCYCTACGDCFFCARGDFHECDRGRIFGHGSALGSLQGAQAEQVLVPHANLPLRRVPDGVSSDAALFAGDVLATGYHAVKEAPLERGATISVVGVYVERIEVHMALVWAKALTVRTGHANVIGHVDAVLELIETRKVDPLPLVTHHMKLADAAEAYAVYDRREALKIVLEP